MNKQILLANTNAGLIRGQINDNFTELYDAVTSSNENVDSTYTTVNSNSANWNSVYTTYKNTSSTFSSQLLSFNQTTKNLTISNGNTVSLSALVDINSFDTGVRGLTGNYSSVYTTVKSNSATWRLEDFIVACSDESTSLTTTTSAVTFRVPFGMYLNSVRASVNIAPVGSTIIVDVKQTGSSIFTTKLSIDASEETSITAATPAVISNPNLTDDAKVIVSIDQVGSSTAGKGLKLTFKGYRV